MFSTGQNDDEREGENQRMLSQNLTHYILHKSKYWDTAKETKKIDEQKMLFLSRVKRRDEDIEGEREKALKMRGAYLNIGNKTSIKETARLNLLHFLIA